MSPAIAWWLWTLWALAAALAAAATWVFLRRKPDGVRRCTACRYDMSAVVGLRCPECGRAHHAEADLFRPRPRWRPAALLLTLALACLLATVPRALWQNAYYAVLPKWRQVSRREVSGCTLREFVTYDPRIPEQRLLVESRGTVILDHSSRYVWPGVTSGATPRGGGAVSLIGDGAADITGDGEPDLIVEDFSGGAHCCTTFIIVQLGAHPRVLDTIDAGNAAFWRPSPDGGLEMVGADYTFDYWKAPHVESAAPAIILRWNNGKFRLAPDALRAPLPDGLDRQEALLRAEPARNFMTESTPPPALWRTMLDLIYTGHAARAREFMDRAWNPEWGEPAKFRREFDEQLARSPFADDIRRMNGE